MKNRSASTYRHSLTPLKLASLAFVLAVAGSPQAAFAASPIRNTSSNLCLAIDGDNTAPWSLAQVRSCTGGPSESWDLTAAGELRTFNGTRCLDVQRNSTAPSALVQSYDCNGGNNQKWTVRADGAIVGVGSGLCLSIRGGTAQPGAGLEIWPCSDVPHQKWTMSGTVTPTSNSLKNTASSLCLGVQGSSTAWGTPTQILPCDNRPGESWAYTAARELRTFDGSFCLDVRGGSTLPGAVVQSFPCNGTGAQKFQVNTDGTVVNGQSGLCVTAIGVNNQAGTGVEMRNCSGSANQRWLREGATAPDTRAPTPPSGLAVSGLTCRSVNLSWQSSTDDVGVAFYDIYHDGQEMTSVSGNTLSAALTVVPGARWGLYVNARDAAGNVSQASASLPIVVPPCDVDTQAPSIPTGLSGTVSGTAITLRWAASSDNVATTGYDVYRNGTRVGTTANLSFTDSGLPSDTQFTYTVAARDAQNNVSPTSAPLALRSGSGCSSAICSVTTVTTETDLPWGLVTLPGGDIIYSRRDAKDLVRLNPATGAKTTLGTVPNAESTDGEGGLLGLAVSPNFPASDPWIYIYHTSPTDNRIVRMRYANGQLDTGSLQVLVSGIGRNKYHNGGRLRYGPDGKIYASTGDAQNGEFAQDLNNLAGKILRLNPDGSRPADNPYGNYVWSYGHRNPQGLAFDSSGRLWAQEFGGGEYDETNLIERGANYGWPYCEGIWSHRAGACANPAYTAPKFTYRTGQGSCSGIAIVRDALYVACLVGQRVYRHTITGNTLTNTQQFFTGTYGRLRTLEPSTDGGLWMTTTSGDKDSIPNNSNDRVFKLTLGN